jgi:hypothetical protein
MQEEINFIREIAPYLIPIVSTVVLIIFIKKYLFTGMMSSETYREQMEREKLVLLHYHNLTDQMNTMLHVQGDVVKQYAEIVAELRRLSGIIETKLGEHIDRLSEVERNMIRHMRDISKNAAD